MKASLPKKFKSFRDKNGSHRRSKSSEPGHKSRPLSADAFLSMFKNDAAKQAARAEEEREKEAAKIEDIISRLDDLKLHDVSRDHISYALSSKFADGNVEKAIELIRIQQQAFSGIVLPYNPNVHMLGAENRGNVTCYLDALLFAMFAKLEAFECMLKNDLTDEAQRKLAGLIRLWVNMLRSGKLIHTDMTEHIQDALAACGWKDAKLLEQQDTSEAFAFITETLQLPLLTLQVDLFHQGKGDEDDHKVVYERLLNLAVPPDPEGKGVKLEDCLEEYFNTKVDVLRDSLEEKKAADKAPLSPKTTIRLVTEDDDSESADRDPSPLQRRWTNVVETPSSPSTSESRPVARHRSTSIIQRIVLDDEGKPTTPTDTTTILQKVKRQGSTVVKAVTIPAWQFFRLIPWHSTSNIEPRDDIDVARQFNQKPVVGICLKRYMMTESGTFKRQNTFIDIPDSLRLPHFMMVDDVRISESSEFNSEYKLVLQSVICHRGDSLHSGHYVSFARVKPKLLTDNRRHDHDPPPDYEEAQWVKFDDLQVDNRVSYVDDIRQSLKEEMPYLLFYQIVPLVDAMTTSTDDNDETEPPSYNDSTVNMTGTQTPSLEVDRPDISRQTSGYFDSTTWTSSGGPSIRFSAELERPPRISLDEESNGSSSHLKANSSRRASIAFTESTGGGGGGGGGSGGTPAVTPEAHSPSVTPSEETTAQRLSRAAARFAKPGSRSRPVSQVGDNRISTTMSRLGLMRTSKEPLRETEDSSEADAPPPPRASSETGLLLSENSNHQQQQQQQQQQHHHHSLHLRKEKDRGKSKNRRSSDSDKGREKSSKHGKAGGVPERECAVM